MKAIKVPPSMCFNETYVVTKSVSGLIMESTEVSLAFYSTELFKKQLEPGITSKNVSSIKTWFFENIFNGAANTNLKWHG